MKNRWQTRPLAEVCQIKPPKAEAHCRLSETDLVSFVPMEDLGIDQKILVPTQTRPLADVAGSYTFFADGDVLLAKITPCFENGKLGIAANLTNGIGFGSSEYIVFRPNRSVGKEWIYYFLSREVFRIEGAKHMSGAVGHKRVAKGFIEAYAIPVPLLSEQQRIVVILEEAFATIAKAKENAKKNLQNVREIFERQLQSIFTTKGDGWVESTIEQHIRFIDYRGKTPKKTASGLRLITAKNVKMGYIQSAPEEFVHPDSYDGWMVRGIPEKGDVLFTTEAPLGNVAQLDTDDKVVFAQRIIIMQADKKLDKTFLKYLLLSAPMQQKILEKGTGATVKGIKASLLKKIEISFPPLPEQKRIVAQLDTLSATTKRLKTIYQQKLADLDELKQSILQKAFNGELTAKLNTSNIISFPKTIPNITTTDLHAGILAIAYQQHEKNAKHKATFGHVKAEKISHMVESHLGINLGRKPVKDAAGPNDYRHLKQVEHRAEKAGYFSFKKKGSGYTFHKRNKFNKIIEKTRAALGGNNDAVDKLILLMLPMDTQQAEIFATVFAAWNNLLISGQDISDEAIVSESRENWHKDKLEIPREKFFQAINWMKQKNIIPVGKGKIVDKVAA